MSRQHDKELLESIPNDKQADFLFMQLRNLWTVDGLYFLGIEEKYGTEIATEIDAKVWSIMGKIEARKLKEFFNVKTIDIPTAVKLLHYTGWALDLEDKEIEVTPTRAVVRNRVCRVQNTRISKGLGEFGCKPVRLGYLKAFVHEINPNIQVSCHHCPPDTHPTDNWCEWELTITETTP
jgi:hypothetical protein